MNSEGAVSSAKLRPAACRPAPRSSAQRAGSTALALVMQAWEELTDEQRQTWRRKAAQRRTHGITWFKQVNLGRLRRAQACLRYPPRPQPRNPGLTLQRLIIRHHRGQLRLELELQRLPVGPTTVWGSLPGNRGLARPRHCPRLGWLPPARNGRCDLTPLYYAKHGNHLRAHSLDWAGKRICIRTRLELDYGTALFEEVQALVPAPKGLKARRPSKDLRMLFEYPS